MIVCTVKFTIVLSGTIVALCNAGVKYDGDQEITNCKDETYLVTVLYVLNDLSLTFVEKLCSKCKIRQRI